MVDSLELRLKAEARRLGFSLSGIAPATDADTFPHYEQWLDAGYAGEMRYLEEKREQRRHPRSVVEQVRSVVMLGYEYSDGLTSAVPLPPSHGRVARYAQGPDYHRLLWDRVNELIAWLLQELPGCRARGVTDTAPLLERDFARRAGLGWLGKNTMLINKFFGSYCFLGALLLDIALGVDPPFETTHCGTCTRCLDACPTNAFVAPYKLDARRCISYLTIELRGAIPEELRHDMGDWIFGCDICQDVCPWNRKAPAGREEKLQANVTALNVDLIELLSLDEDGFRARFRHTPIWRTKRSGLLRNAAIALGNIGNADAIPALQRALDDAERVVRDAASWAIGRLRAREISNNEISHPIASARR